MPFLKCMSCSKNEGNTQIKIKSSCLEKPVIFNFDSNDNNNIEVIESILHIILNTKTEEKPQENESNLTTTNI